MAYSVLRRANENHDIFYCVGMNDEPMTNPTHSALGKAGKSHLREVQITGAILYQHVV